MRGRIRLVIAPAVDGITVPEQVTSVVGARWRLERSDDGDTLYAQRIPCP